MLFTIIYNCSAISSRLLYLSFVFVYLATRKCNTAVSILLIFPVINVENPGSYQACVWLLLYILVRYTFNIITVTCLTVPQND